MKKATSSLTTTDEAFADLCLPHLKEPLLQEAIVRDLCNGGWSAYCLNNAGNLHRLAKEIIKKLDRDNRLRRFPSQKDRVPTNPQEWCDECLDSMVTSPLTGIIAAHSTKQAYRQGEIASIEKLAGTVWWQNRSPSLTVDRKTEAYQKVLDLVFQQANSLMFIDPNIDPSSYNYREFFQLFGSMRKRSLPPAIEIHRSFCRGDGPARTFPTEADWKESFEVLGGAMRSFGLVAEVFLWEDFHERYLIADVVGVSVPAGFDITTRGDDWSTWGRLGREDKDKIQRLFDPAVRPKSLKWRFRIGDG